MTEAPAAHSTEYLSAKETIGLLDIKPQTLYAYVSRGLIRSASQPGKKARIYLRSDVERVHARALARSGHGPVAAEAMNHGQPIIPTSITELTPHGPSYRGHLATGLAAAAASFESVAELLWTGIWSADGSGTRWTIAAPPAALVRTINSFRHSCSSEQLREVFALVTLHLGLNHAQHDSSLPAANTYEDARQIIGVLVGCCGLASPQGRYMPMQKQAIAQGLLRALGGDATQENSDAINAMLTLLADHELSPGTLSARVAASGGATLHACIAAAICSSSGVNVAQVFDQVHDFLATAGSASGLRKQAMARLDQGKPIPGFSHPLYPHGDPRASMLLDFIRTRKPTRPLMAVHEFVTEIEHATGLHVRHELPMVALTRAMGLPRQATGAIFLLSRIAGWVAHIQEQRLSGQLLRPRARFVHPAL